VHGRDAVLRPVGGHAEDLEGAQVGGDERQTGDPGGRSDTSSAVDRRLAYKNLRTGLIAGAISLIVFALAWVVGLVY
jgi:hypothetical protein